MKQLFNYLLILIIMQTLNETLFAQVNTPFGSPIEYSTKSPGDVALYEDEAAAFLKNRGWTSAVTKTENATSEYNCHSYAWYMSEGGTKNYWIDAFSNEDLWFFDLYSISTTPPVVKNINKFWTDSSYIEVTENQATKVWFGSCWTWDNTLGRWTNLCDHSAVRLSSGLYESKWGKWGRYIHPADKSPYTTSNRRYFKKNTIIFIGPDLVSDKTTYTFSPTPVTYTFQISPNLTLVSSVNNSVTVTPAYNGSAFINILVNGIVIAQKSLLVGPPLVSGFYYDGYALNAQFYGSSSSVIKTEWTIDYNVYSSAGTWIYPPVNTGTHTISVRAYNNLGWGSPFTTDFTFPGSSMYSINLNSRNVSVAPASTQLTGFNSRADASSVNNALSYSVIDLMSGVVAVTGKLPATGGAVDLSNLPSGIYVFRLDDGMGNVQSIKIILK